VSGADGGLARSRTGRVAELLLDRPDRLNAIDASLVESLHAALEELRQDHEVGVVTVRGNGRAFCAGSDVRDMARRPQRHLLEGEELARARTVERNRLARAFDVVVRIAEMPQPTLAGLHGAVAGAGIGLALACDLRIAAASTVFVPAWPALALPGDWGVTRLLPAKAGDRAARRLLIGGERIGAEEALALGLVDAVVPDGDLQQALSDRAELLAGTSVTAVGATKALLAVPGLRDAVREEIEATMRCQESDEHTRAVRSFAAPPAAPGRS
jgi:2-(1,2-epoxy-1,2-dihydrophenyl)acetyl-CoA isomerase